MRSPHCRFCWNFNKKKIGKALVYREENPHSVLDFREFTFRVILHLHDFRRNSHLNVCLYVVRHECCWSFIIAWFLEWRKPCARLELVQNVCGVYRYSTRIDSHFTMDDYRGIFRRLYFVRSLPRCEIKQIWFGKLDFITRRMCVSIGKTKTECDPAIITNKVAEKYLFLAIILGTLWVTVTAMKVILVHACVLRPPVQMIQLSKTHSMEIVWNGMWTMHFLWVLENLSYQNHMQRTAKSSTTNDLCKIKYCICWATPLQLLAE